ncbi:hypothetical protein COOONC_04927 [Cooperia oncophora]
MLRDGSQFLQVDEPRFHTCYSARIIQMACENGHHGLIADGSRSLHTKHLGNHAQLYYTRGVCNQEMDIHRCSAKETRRDYRGAFEHLFSEAAIQAAKAVFPIRFEGSAFHLAQAWNRKETASGYAGSIKVKKG